MEVDYVTDYRVPERTTMSQPTTAIPTLSPNLDDTLGPMLIGVLFSMTYVRFLSFLRGPTNSV